MTKKFKLKPVHFVVIGIVLLFLANSSIFLALAPGIGQKVGRITMLNNLVTVNEPFSADMDGAIGEFPALTEYFRFSIDNKHLSVSDLSNQCGGYGLGGSNLIMYEKFKELGKTNGKQIVKLEMGNTNNGCAWVTNAATCTEYLRRGLTPPTSCVDFMTWDIIGEVEIFVDSNSCVLQPGTVVVAETFSAGHTVNQNSFRYPVTGFCSSLPILVTEQGRIVDKLIEEYDIMMQSYVTIPANQTWTFFYLADATSEMTLICKKDTYNPTTGQCEAVPGIIWACSVGVFDPVEGLCVVQPDIRYVCEMGYYDTQRTKCVYQIQAGQTSAICPAGSIVETWADQLERCVFDADTDLICGKGQYDQVDKVCKFVAQPIPIDNLWSALTLLWDNFISWVRNLFGW